MSFDPSTDFGYNPGVALEPLTETAADAIAQGGPVFEKYAVGRRLYELEQRKASSAILSNAVAGCVAYATISLATLPLTGSTWTIGRDVYQAKAAAAEVTDDAYVGIETNADKDVVGASLAAAINAANVRNQHRTLLKTDGTTPARANGSENVRAAYVAGTDTLWIFAAEEPGGTLVQGTAPDLALDATATGAPAWSVANLNLSPGAGHQNMSVWRERIAITAGMISAGSVSFAVPFYSATYFARVTAYTAAGEKAGTVKAVTDSLALAAGPISGTGVATLTLPGGGGDLAATNIAYLEIWAPAVETLAVPVSEARVLDGRLDLAEAAIAVLQGYEPGKSYTFTMTGAGDKAEMADTDPKVFTSKATVPANAMAIDDWADWEAEVWIDNANATPGVAVKLFLGTAELESQSVTTAAANDYVIVRGRGRVTGATTLRCYKGLGETKDGTLSAHVHAVPADVTIQAMTAARDVTASVTASAGHADNEATIKSLRFTVHKAA